MAFARSTHVLHSIVMTLTYIECVWLLFACLLYLRKAAVDLILLSKFWNCKVLPLIIPDRALLDYHIVNTRKNTNATVALGRRVSLSHIV